MSAVEEKKPYPETPKKVDIRTLLAEIRSRVLLDAEKFKDKKKPFKPLVSNADDRASYKAGTLARSENLAYLNRNYFFSFRSKGAPFTSSKGGIIGKIIVKLKTKFIALREFILRDYIESEKEFFAHLVRHLNDISQYIDDRDSACFWELINKIDVDISKALERIEIISDEQSANLRSTERRVYDEIDKTLGEVRRSIEDLRTARVQHAAKLQQLDGVSHGLEAIVAQLKSPAPEIKQVSDTPHESTESSRQIADYSYVLLENRYRGSEDEIAKRMEIYPAYFSNVSKPVLEIGGGRGELQTLFKKKGVRSYSVDIDQAMVEHGKTLGLEVILGDGLAHLRSLPDSSLSGVIAVQVVEHLTKQQLEELMRLCNSKVESGGKVIFETINPQSLLALSSNYFRDLTHVFPLHPDTLGFVMELSGLKVVETKMLSPVPQEAQLKPVPIEEYMTPRWAYTVETMNRNIERINDLIYGYQDYCIIAEAKRA